MKKIYIIIGLMLFGCYTNAQIQITNYGNIRIFGGTSITTFGDFNNTGTLTVDSAVTLNNIGSLVNTGTISNSGTFVYASSATLTYGGLSQQTIGKELPSSSGPSSLIINNSNNVVLGVDATINNLTFTSGNLLIDGRTLTINGNVTHTSGTISGGANANLNFVGNSSTINFDQTSSTTRTINNLTVNNAASTLTLGSAVEVTGNLNLNNGTLASGGNLKLVSNANGTAKIPAITGTGAITGNVTVERYVPSLARRWRFLSPTISNTTLEDWRGEIFITGGTGSTIVGTTNTGGFDATVSNSSSAKYYDETVSGVQNNGWTVMPTTATSLVPGKGYLIFVRGDRSSLSRLTGVDNSQNAVTMNLIGNVNTGDISLPVTYTNYSLTNDDGWNLLGNPYPCEYDWYSFWNQGNTENSGTYYSNINPTIYVWDATSNTYKSFNALSNSGSLSNGVIASGQAFFVKASAASPSITFKEQFKSNSLPIQMFKSATADELKIKLTFDSVNYDDFNLTYNPLSTNNKDAYDIKKWLNPTVNISSYGYDSVLLALDSRPSIIGIDTIRLNVTGSNGTYAMLFNNLPSAFANYFLKDLYLNNTVQLSKGVQYNFNIQSSIAATQGANRFLILSSNSNLPVTFGEFSAVKEQKSVQLKWNTLSEINCSRFEIQRSFNNIDFVSLGVVASQGNSNSNAFYSYTDEQPSWSAVNYYRIKQIDKNEKFSYSAIREVQFNRNIQSASISVYPNPVKDFMVVSSSVLSTGNAIVYLYNAEGLLINEYHTKAIANGALKLSVQNYIAGFYFIKIKTEDGFVFNQKFIVE